PPAVRSGPARPAIEPKPHSPCHAPVQAWCQDAARRSRRPRAPSSPRLSPAAAARSIVGPVGSLPAAKLPRVRKHSRPPPPAHRARCHRRATEAPAENPWQTVSWSPAREIPPGPPGRAWPPIAPPAPGQTATGRGPAYGADLHHGSILRPLSPTLQTTPPVG